jgi:hypothetical protein
MEPSFTEVVRLGSCPDATVMPIVGGFPSSFVEVVRSVPLCQSRLLASLAEPRAFDILPAVRSEECEVRSAVDCSVLEIPLLGSMVKAKFLRLLGKKVLDVGLSA